VIDEVYLDRIGGRIVTLVEYHQERQRRRVEQIPVFCTECKHRAVPYDPADLEKPRGFRHFGSPDQGRPWCLKGDNGRRGGEVVWRLHSEEYGRTVRAAFIGSNMLETAYRFCCAGSWGELDAARFMGLLRWADSRNLWRAEGLRQWQIGFHLLREHQFTHKDTRFYFDWRLSADIARVVKADGSLHSMPERWALVRMFLDSRKPTHGGPLLFSEAALGQLAGQAGWRCRREAERLRGLLAA